jgi:hypothetical protein
MKYLLSLLIFAFFLFSCKHKATNLAKKNSQDSTQFYPIADFIQEQISFVELRDFDIHLRKEVDGKIDSSMISKEIFRKIASPFLDKDISALKQHFTESVFQDLSTNSYTLNYRAKLANEPIQNIDILLFENSKTVKRLFILSQMQKNDSSMLQHHNWTANKNFQITTSIKTNAGLTSNEIIQVYWKKKNSSRE